MFMFCCTASPIVSAEDTVSSKVIGDFPSAEAMPLVEVPEPENETSEATKFTTVGAVPVLPKCEDEDEIPENLAPPAEEPKAVMAPQKEIIPVLKEEPPMPPPRNLLVSLAPGNFGFTYDVMDGELVVTGLLGGGSLEAYNKTAPHGQKVYRGDVIVKANGETQVEAMKTQIQRQQDNKQSLNLEVKQAPTLELSLKRVENLPLGLGLEQTFPADDSAREEVHEKLYLKVKEVKPTGVVPLHNAANPEVAVTNAHYFVEVNGERVDTAKMIEHIKNDNEWTFVFRCLDHHHK